MSANQDGKNGGSHSSGSKSSPTPRHKRPIANKLRRSGRVLKAAWQKGALEKLCIAFSSVAVVVGIAGNIEETRHTIGGDGWRYLLAHACFVYIAMLAALLIALRRI